MNHSLQDLMRDATRLTQAGQLGAATQAIQRALGGLVIGGAAAAAPAGEVIDVQAVEVVTRPTAAPQPTGHTPASFIGGTHSHAGLQRDYKLYLPPGAAGQALPLVVMLHGCTQDPDDFAAGTGMNALAAARGVAVLYPAQAQNANPSRCWNWFKHNHQQAGRGEAALIASLAQAVVRQHGLDAGRVFIAGLSAGGAMAALVAAAHPAQFAAVGVHSGLAPGAAQDLNSGLAAMRSGAASTAPLPVPTIAFHGDQDSTVHPRNGEQLLAAAIRGAAPAGAQTAQVQGMSAAGQRYTRSSHGLAGQPASAELWLLHGAGHAWAGGRAAGSYTDARGPDASAEMLRFFLSQPPRPR
ncbi:MAG: PHB depolymerase family esterase [Pseudomonadota bacterium]